MIEPREPLVDPFRDALLEAGDDLPERMKALAEPLRGDPAFDPEAIRRAADALPLPSLAVHPFLEESVRVGLAHVDATFQGDHPKYGAGRYAAPQHDGFPPTIIAAVDALTLWGLTARADALFGYWLREFVRADGSIAYYGPSLSEYGQLLTTARRWVERGGSREVLRDRLSAIRGSAGYLQSLLRADGPVRLLPGVPEADERDQPATYFHNNAWIVRGLEDWAMLLDATGDGSTDETASLRQDAAAVRGLLLPAIEDAWPDDPAEWWLRPMAEAESGGYFTRPAHAVTETRLGSYTNYRYWPELLSSGVLPRRLAERVVSARLNGGGQYLGMTRFEGHLDDWPLMDHLDGLWSLGRTTDYYICLWGHVLYHQADGHLTAYEQASFPPGRSRADYCLPCQLVAARAVRRLCPLASV